MIHATRPDRLARTLAVLRRWGLTPAGACAVAAIRHPDRAAVVDERGAVSFGQLQHRTNALARALRKAGVADGDTVAVMCANRRGFIEAIVAASKLGVHLLCLDTELPPGRVTDVLGRGRPAAVIHDEQFASLIVPAGVACPRFIASCEPGERPSGLLLEDLIAREATDELAPPRNRAGMALLTVASGGSAQHVERTVPCSLVAPAAMLSPIPLRRGETTVLAAPLCHPWGFVHLKLGLRLGSTLVLPRPCDPHGGGAPSRERAGSRAGDAAAHRGPGTRRDSRA